MASLCVEEKEQLRLQNTDKLTALSEVLTDAQKKREQCGERRWKYTGSDGTNIVLHEVFDKIVSWIDKFKQIGDFIAQVDTVHAAVPWAAISFFLKVERSPVPSMQWRLMEHYLDCAE